LALRSNRGSARGKTGTDLYTRCSPKRLVCNGAPSAMSQRQRAAEPAGKQTRGGRMRERELLHAVPAHAACPPAQARGGRTSVGLSALSKALTSPPEIACERGARSFILLSLSL